MKDNFWTKFLATFRRIFINDSEIDTGDGKIQITSTVKFLIGWGVFLLLVLLYLLIAKPFKAADDVGSSEGGVLATDETGKKLDYVPFERNAYEDINAFVDSYLNALTTADINLIGAMVKDPTQFDSAELQLRAQKILHYSNVDCYSKPGLTDDCYVVYAIVNTQIVGVDVRPLSLHRFYLVKNEFGGYIQDNTVGSNPEITAYLNQLDQDPDVVELYERVNQNNAEAAAQDPKLQEFYNSIGQSAAPATEAPATETPPTEAPATEAPATEAPATEAPATEAPATEAPATEAPTQ